MLDQLNPQLSAIHREDADAPTECITLMAQDFKALLWESVANVPSYGQWLMKTDQEFPPEEDERDYEVACLDLG